MRPRSQRRTFRSGPATAPSYEHHPGAADDQPPVPEPGLGDLCLAGVRVVLDGGPVLLRDLGDQRPDLLAPMARSYAAGNSSQRRRDGVPHPLPRPVGRPVNRPIIYRLGFEHTSVDDHIIGGGDGTDVPGEVRALHRPEPRRVLAGGRCVVVRLIGGFSAGKGGPPTERRSRSVRSTTAAWLVPGAAWARP